MSVVSPIQAYEFVVVVICIVPELAGLVVGVSMAELLHCAPEETPIYRTSTIKNVSRSVFLAVHPNICNLRFLNFLFKSSYFFKISFYKVENV